MIRLLGSQSEVVEGPEAVVAAVVAAAPREEAPAVVGASVATAEDKISGVALVTGVSARVEAASSVATVAD